MKKTAALAAMYFAILLTVSPLTIAMVPHKIVTDTTDTNTDWNYIPMNVPIQISSTSTSPDGLPLCNSRALGNIVCYSPAFIKKAYEYPSTATLDGSGQTIVIVDAFGSPTIASDLTAFDTRFGIPAAPSFTILCGNGVCPTVPITANPRHDVFGWSIETSLDVEYAHAMAPGANIVLDVASTSSGNAINDATASAIALYPGAVFSQSFGIPEIFINPGSNNAQVMQAQKNFATGVAAGDTFFASAGDTGADFGTGVTMGNFPGTDLHNTAVTGTQGNPYIATGSLTACPSATTCTSGLSTYMGPCAPGSRFSSSSCTPVGYGGEQVWNEPAFGAATGGAQSLLFGVPSYQLGLGLTTRGPDVSYNAAVNGGVLVQYGGFGFPVLFIVGGTSAGSPQWAGIIALANQARAGLLTPKGPIGDLNPVLYSILGSSRYSTDFHDITVGDDKLLGTHPGFSAGTGYDLASGIGTPIVDQLIIDLTAAP